MKVDQSVWSRDVGWTGASPRGDAQLLLVFGAPDALTAPLLDELQAAHRSAVIMVGSTAGEIHGTSVLDETVVATAVRFERVQVRAAEVVLADCDSSFEAGRRVAAQLPPDGLRHLFVLSDGLSVNGSELVRGLTSALSPSVQVTGGLCADGDRFQRTLAGLGRGAAAGRVAAVGFYGDALRVGTASLGGWDPFGPERLITRSTGNVLYELDGVPALELYRRYLGEHAAGLPASGLLFPLSLRTARGEGGGDGGGDGDGGGLVRTILSIDEAAGSITFAGDLPQGSFARLMKANFDRLIDGALGAAAATLPPLDRRRPELGILISCVGRKLVLKQRVEEEVEAVREVLGEGVPLCGFYSYGEISPFTPTARCQLHNQTMTITTLSEQ